MAAHIRSFNKKYYNARSNNQPLFLLFIDFKKAFDSIHHKTLFLILQKIKIPATHLQLIKSLFTNVTAKTTVPGAKQLLLQLERGIKQGDPSSPIFFNLPMDVLFMIAKTLQEIEAKGFADDVGILLKCLSILSILIPKFQAFSLHTGLFLNGAKTKILPTKPPTTAQIAQLQNITTNTPWELVTFCSNYKYLGIKIGYDLSRISIYEEPLNKFLKRLQSLMPHKNKLPLQKKIIICNVFLISIFSFHIAFHYLHHNTFIKVENALRTFLSSPINYFKLSNLYTSTHYVSLRPPLLNLQLQNLAALAKQVDNLNLDQFDLPHLIGTHSLITEEQAHDALSVICNPDINLGYNANVDTNALPHSQKYLYTALINSPYCITQHRQHLKKRLRYHRLPHPRTQFNHLTHNFATLPSKLPAYIRTHQFKMIYNGLATAKRLTPIALNHHTMPHIYGTHPCFLCGLPSSEDSQRHIYSRHCPTYSLALNLSVQHFNIPVDTQHIRGIAHLTHQPYNSRTLIIITTLNTHTWMNRCDALRTQRPADSRNNAFHIFLKTYLSANPLIPNPTPPPLLPPPI